VAHQASALVKVRFLKARRWPAGTSYHQSVILRRNNLMRLPEFTRPTTLPWSSPAWPYLLLLWPESLASRYCGQTSHISISRWRRRRSGPPGGGKPATEGQQAPPRWKKEKSYA